MLAVTMARLTTVLTVASAILAGCVPAEVKRVRKMEIGEVDLASVSDGTHAGEFAYGGFTYRVAVRVKDCRIDSIEILQNRTTAHARKAEGVVARVLEAQTSKVDAVSGATTTSKALLKAIENALRSGTAR